MLLRVKLLLNLGNTHTYGDLTIIMHLYAMIMNQTILKTPNDL